jgi:large exoprotein involved in heme utilization and adhesion
MLAHAYFAGAAGADAFLAVLHGGFQAAQGMVVQLGGGKTFVAGKAAAVNTLGDDHLAGAAADDIDQALGPRPGAECCR